MERISSAKFDEMLRLLLIKLVWGLISLLLILPHLVQLCLSHLLIILILRMMKLKLK